jgi:hypothetical protein
VRIRRAEEAEIKEKNREWQRKEVERERQSREEQKKDPGPYRGPRYWREASADLSTRIGSLAGTARRREAISPIGSRLRFSRRVAPALVQLEHLKLATVFAHCSFCGRAGHDE